MLDVSAQNWPRVPGICHRQLVKRASSKSRSICWTARLCPPGLPGQDCRLMAWTISALNCSGNPLIPASHGQRHHEVTLKTFRLASPARDRYLIVMMSGLPGGPGDANPNWITTEWPPECLGRSWSISGTRCCFLIGATLVKSCRRAWASERSAWIFHGAQGGLQPDDASAGCGKTSGRSVGANYDPSHPIWMGADPLAAVRALGSSIYYVHAKDTRVFIRAGWHRRRSGYPPVEPARSPCLELRHLGLRSRRDVVAAILCGTRDGWL